MLNKLIYYWSKLFKKIRGAAIVGSEIHPTSSIEAGSNIVNVKFDKHSYCGYDCQIVNAKIGPFTSIASNVVIGGGMHPMEWVSMSPVFYEGKDSIKGKFSKHKRESTKTTEIGHDVWIGQGVIIKQGVTIGDGAVIGMGSIVTKDMTAYGIYAGNPAKLIRMRFDKETCEKLQASKWWTMDDKQLKEFAHLFTEPKLFLDKILK
ncbi:MAG: CatB-related O-acetyltransferase [Bacteroidota bacterium]